jgi:hypothetical protein
MDARRCRLPIAGVAALIGIMGSTLVSGHPKATSTNVMMNRIYRLDGDPDEKSSSADAEIWRYRSVPDLNGISVDFEFN